MKKKYKYYCKKHDASYLIKSTRQKAKESSKENRFNLVQKFRSLNVTADLQTSMENENNCNTQNNDDTSFKTEVNQLYTYIIMMNHSFSSFLF